MLWAEWERNKWASSWNGSRRRRGASPFLWGRSSHYPTHGPVTTLLLPPPALPCLPRERVWQDSHTQPAWGHQNANSVMESRLWDHGKMRWNLDAPAWNRGVRFLLGSSLIVSLMSLPPSDALYSGCNAVPCVSLVIPKAISSSLEKAYLFFWLPLSSKSSLYLYISFNLSNDLDMILTPTWPSLISGFRVLLLCFWIELLSAHRGSIAIMSNLDLS